MQIIVQAGGKGTRLGDLTVNRPKCLVPVHNTPMIFHLFKKFQDAEFVIIGDYKYEVLKKYLKNFAKNINYRLIKSTGTGNVCGIKKALKYIRDNEKLMIIWSDLILSEEFKPELLPSGNYVGVFDDKSCHPCSWSFVNGKLEKISTDKQGVAGCFLFENKALLKDITTKGSFTGWLKNSNLDLKPMIMKSCFEVGTIDVINSLKDTENRCRLYNKLEFSDKKVVKTGLTEEGKVLINKEVEWYKSMTKYGFDSIPKIYSYNPLTMQRIKGENIFLTNSTTKRKEIIMDNLLNAINKMHSYENFKADKKDIIKEYYSKTISRINTIKNVIPFANRDYIKINGENCKNPLFFKKNYKKYVENNLIDTIFCPIHGDCTLTNTLVDEKNNIYFIDARGYFGSKSVIGDIRYDWAKLYYSIIGNFDKFNIKDFSLKTSESEINYKISSNDWESLYNKLISNIKPAEIENIKFIHAVIWLSLASHCREDYDSMCLAFYNGVYLINEFL